jgi:hypothetical protein
MITWAETSNPDLINKVENGRYTTYRKGTQGWNEFEAWKAQGNEPTPYDAVFPARQNKLSEINQRCESEIISVYPIWKQNNILMRLQNNATGQAYTDQDESDMKSYISQIRAQCFALESQANAAQTVAEIESITWGT